MGFLLRRRAPGAFPTRRGVFCARTTFFDRYGRKGCKMESRARFVLVLSCAIIGAASVLPCFAQENQSLRTLEMKRQEEIIRRRALEEAKRRAALEEMKRLQERMNELPRCDLSFDPGCSGFYRQHCKQIPVPDNGTRMYGSSLYRWECRRTP